MEKNKYCVLDGVSLCVCKHKPCEQIKIYENLINDTIKIINDFAKQEILTFPDLKPKENYKIIQKQCCEPLLEIITKINEVNNANRK